MPKRTDAPLDPAERRRQVASILARGVARWRRHAAHGLEAHTTSSDAQESASAAENRLELSRETRLSVSDGTRWLTGETPIPPPRAPGTPPVRPRRTSRAYDCRMHRR